MYLGGIKYLYCPEMEISEVYLSEFSQEILLFLENKINIHEHLYFNVSVSF